MEYHGAAAAGAPSRRRDGDLASLGRFLGEARLMHRSLFGELVGRLSSQGGPPDSAQVAHELVRTGVLTAYQGAAIYQGKGKGLLIGPYIVLDKLGGGGMGMVFKAFHRDHRVVVALKILPPSFSRRSQAIVDRFRREAVALAKTQHPNIVCSFETPALKGLAGPRPHLGMAMDHDCESFQQSIPNHGKLGISRGIRGAGRKRSLIAIVFVFLVVCLIFLVLLEALELLEQPVEL